MSEVENAVEAVAWLGPIPCDGTKPEWLPDDAIVMVAFNPVASQNAMTWEFAEKRKAPAKERDWEAATAFCVETPFPVQPPAASEGERASLRLERENNLAKEMEHREGIAANLRRALHRLEDRFGTLPLAPALCLLEQLSPQISGAQCPAPSDQEKLSNAQRLALEDADWLDKCAVDADENNWPDWSAGMRQSAMRIRSLTRARQATPAPSDQAGNSYLVWSNEHKAWWGPEHRGYTCVIANAGRYDRAEALKIAGTRDGGWWLNKGNPDEIAIPEQDAIDQYADITRAQEAATPTLTAGEGGGDE